jgi:hypothetical protein
MAEHADLLRTIAQISIAFAGFSGVIAAFGRFHLAPEATVFRVRMMVVAALVTLLYSLLPFLPTALGLSESYSWRISAALMGIGLVAVYARTWTRLKLLFRAGLLDTQKHAIVVYSIGAILIVALFASATAPVAPYAPAVYVTGIFFGLAMSSYYFIMLMFAVEIDRG